MTPELRSVCLDVANYSVEDTLAVRIIVDYTFAAAPAHDEQRDCHADDDARQKQ